MSERTPALVIEDDEQIAYMMIIASSPRPASGAKAYIVKPFKPEALRHAVRKVVKYASA